MIRRAIRSAVVPAVMLTAGGCFATRSDVRTLQGDLAVMRAENVRSDSVHRAQFQQAAVQAGALSDSLRAVSAFLARFATDVSRFQGDLAINMHTYGQQLLSVQELMGQSQKKLQDLKAQFERQETELATPTQPVVTSPAPGAPAATGAASAPQTGPDQLFAIGQAQLSRGSYAAARSAFEDFLTQFPNNDRAGEAQWSIARSFDNEGNAPAADSVYALVVERYPKATFAANALYKRAMNAKQANQIEKARGFFQQILDNYPKSPEALLAPDAIKDLIKKP